MTDQAAPSSSATADPAATLGDDPILVVDGLRRVFGGLTAVDVEHLEVPRGKITALIGPNGAGKSTFFNLVTGFDRADAGTWTFDGQRIEGLQPHRVARLGLVRSFQLTRALSKLTVLQNMLLAAPDQVGERFLPALLTRPWRAQEARITEQADELLARFRLDHVRDDRAETLSGGQRKLLDMARALMSDPAMICLDEPMAGVNPALTQSLLTHIQGLRDAGRTVLFVEHDIDMVMEISDWVVVLAEGKVTAQGPPAQVARDERVIEAYLGGALPSEIVHDDEDQP